MKAATAPRPDHVSVDLWRTSPRRDTCGASNIFPSKGKDSRPAENFPNNPPSQEGRYRGSSELPSDMPAECALQAF
ncbi:unnamed protein product [Strongylus vulgaris]|uniref:Uncharacterized protein n=1 Tax=Strongylus vulgaris TaxID=40348 RepID=A0A3P7LTF1_STRVU|nr:unnamed protein product [Strongylus vulgaris]